MCGGSQNDRTLHSKRGNRKKQREKHKDTRMHTSLNINSLGKNSHPYERGGRPLTSPLTTSLGQDASSQQIWIMLKQDSKTVEKFLDKWDGKTETDS